MEENQPQSKLQELRLRRPKKVSGLMIRAAWIIFVVGTVIVLLITQASSFSLNTYTQMSVEQRILVTLDKTNNFLLGIGVVLVAMFFAILAIYYKKEE